MDQFDCSNGWHFVGMIDDVPRLGARVVAAPKGDVAVFRTASDEIFALEDRCPHKGGPLSQGIVHGKHVTCPLHNWQIALPTGEAVAPDRGCAPGIPVRLDGRRILLRLGPMHPVKTTCPYCGVGCGVVASPDGTVKGDTDHPANEGRLCSKGSALAPTLDDRDRLLLPRIDGTEAGWDEALGLVASRFAETIATDGPDSVAFYVSGQCLTEDYYVANKLMKGFIGSSNIDTNSRLCMASAVAGHLRAFGADVVPGLYEDFEEADLVVLVGSNLAWCHPVLFQRLAAARKARGTRIVTIDPRRTSTSEIADLHLPLAAGADVALFDGLLTHLALSGCINAKWVDRHTTGIEAALEAAGCSAGTVEQAAALTGLPKADIETFYAWYAATERTVTIFSQGVNQSVAGTDKVNAIINCHLATGRIGRPGMGPFSITGQPNAMGGREVGGLANMLAAHMGYDDPANVDRVRRFWNAPRIARRPGLKAVDLFDAVLDGRIKALWIMATNPAASMPRAGRVREALAACPFVVVSDCWETDTTRFGRVVLPAAGWGEKDGTVTNSDRRISRQRAFRAPPGDARPDWWMLAEAARRMGWAEAFAYRSAAGIFREHAALSAFENDGQRAFDIGALATLTDEAYGALEPVRWPLPATRPSSGDGRFFADGRFFTPDGRARFVSTPLRAPADRRDRRYPFILNTGRIRDQWHTMTRTGRVPQLMEHDEEPVLAVAPEDAPPLSLGSGDLVRIATRHGTAILPWQPSDAQRPGDVFAPMHWTDAFSSAGPIDRLVGNGCDPVSGQPELKATPASLAAVRPLWRGLLLHREPVRPGGDLYWARTQIAAGHALRMAGWQKLPDGDELAGWAAALLGEPADAEQLRAFGQESFRYAAIRDGHVLACLFLAWGEARLPAPESVAQTLGASREDANRLIGSEDHGSGEVPSRTVCVCFSVRLDTLRRTVRETGVTNVAQIGAALRAGTNCGSCIPELEEILRDVHLAA